MEKLKHYLFIEQELAKAKEKGEKTVAFSIWNMYRFEYVKIMAEKDGHKVSLKKRDENDTHHFEVTV